MGDEVLAEKLGGLIRRLRFSKGWNQADFGAACKLDRTYIGMIERGQVNITLRTAFKLARGLEMPPSDLIFRLERELDTSTRKE